LGAEVALCIVPGQEEIDSLVKSLEMVNKEIPEGFDQVNTASSDPDIGLKKLMCSSL
jgi:hypothetical protein